MIKFRLLLVEGNRYTRLKIAGFLKPYKEVIHSAVSGDNALIIKALSDFLPEVVLLNLKLYIRDSFEIAETLRSKAPEAKVILMAVPPDEQIMLIVKAGAIGFIPADATEKDYLYAIKQVVSGKSFLPASLTQILFAQISDAGLEAENLAQIDHSGTTKREKEIISFFSEGLSNKEISAKMGISTYTVKSHIHTIMDKMSLHSRLEIANNSHNHTHIRRPNETRHK